MTEDYSAPLSRAKTYLREAEECLKDKNKEGARVFLNLLNQEIGKLVEWVNQ